MKASMTRKHSRHLSLLVVVLCQIQNTTALSWWPFGSRVPPAPSCEPTVLPLDVQLEANSKVVQAGQEYFLTYHSKSRHNECWNQAFVSINEACSNMHTPAQQELALKFADCFMRDSGRQLHPCVASNKHVAVCLQQLDGPSFAVYTEFFTHLESMCHYIQAEVWQRSAQATINSLSQNAAQAAHTLLKTHTLQETLLTLQQQQLDGYSTLHAHQTALEAEMAQSAKEIDDKFEGLMKTAHQMSVDLVTQAASLEQIIDFKALYAAGQLEVLERLRAASENLDGYVDRVEDMLAQAQQSHDHMASSIGYVERIISGVTSMWGTVCVTVTLALWLNIILACTSATATAPARSGLIVLWFCLLISEGCDRLLEVHTIHTKEVTHRLLLVMGCVWFVYRTAESCCKTPRASREYNRDDNNNDERGIETATGSTTTSINLYTANRRKLQMLAKANGIPANWSSDAILEALGGKP